MFTCYNLINIRIIFKKPYFLTSLSRLYHIINISVRTSHEEVYFEANVTIYFFIAIQ